MVFFVCNNCGDSMKKPKVDQHRPRCPSSTISCSDCSKDFTYQSYKAHTSCVTEDQKYGGANYQAKNAENKQGQKQQRFVEIVNEIASTAQIDGQIKGYVNKMLNFDNIPRKKPKFVNFIKSALSLQKESIANQLWAIVEQAAKRCSAEVQQQAIANKQNGQSKSILQQNGDRDSLLKTMTTTAEKRKPDDQNGGREEKKLKTEEIENPDQNESVEQKDAKDFSKANVLIDEMVKSAETSGELVDVIKFAKRLLQNVENQEIRLKHLKKYAKKVHPFTKYARISLNDFYNKLISKMKTKTYYEFDKSTIKFKSLSN